MNNAPASTEEFSLETTGFLAAFASEVINFIPETTKLSVGRYNASLSTNAFLVA